MLLCLESFVCMNNLIIAIVHDCDFVVVQDRWSYDDCEIFLDSCPQFWLKEAAANDLEENNDGTKLRETLLNCFQTAFKFEI